MASLHCMSEPETRDGTDGRSKRTTAILGGLGAGAVVVAVLLVAALGGGSKSTNKAAGTSGSPTTARSAVLAWSKASLGGKVIGTWATAADVIVALPDAVTAYDIATGKRAWSWQAPSGRQICRLSQSTSNPRGALLYGSTDDCASLQVLDLASGKPLWSAPVDLAGPGREEPSANPVGLFIQDSYLVAPYDDRDVVDIDLATAKPVWNTNGTVHVGGCTFDGAVMVGTTVYYATSGDCGGGAGAPYRVWARDAASTAAATSLSVPVTCYEPALLQAGSDLLVVCNWRQGNPSLLLATPGSSSLTTVKATNRAFAQVVLGAFSSNRQETQKNMAVYGNTLYLPDTSDDIEFDSITAVDLRTGNALWTAPLTKADKVQGLPAATSSGVILTHWTNQNTYTITTLAAATGAQSAATTIAVNGQDAAKNVDLLVGDYFIGVDTQPMPGTGQLVAYRIS